MSNAAINHFQLTSKDTNPIKIRELGEAGAYKNLQIAGFLEAQDSESVECLD